MSELTDDFPVVSVTSGQCTTSGNMCLVGLQPGFTYPIPYLLLEQSEKLLEIPIIRIILAHSSIHSIQSTQLFFAREVLSL